MYYTISGMKGKIHIDTMTGKTLLCGRRPGLSWEVQYEGVVYAEIQGKSVDSSFKTKDFREGLEILNAHQPRIYFCPKCYKKYIESIA